MKAKNLFLILLIIITSALHSQKLHTGFYSTDGSVNVVKQQGCDLYLGGSFYWIGHKEGAISMFNEGISKPDTNFPFIRDARKIIPDGKGGWYIAGGFDKLNFIPVKKLIRLKPNLTIDPSFKSPDFHNYTFQTMLLDETYLYLAGDITITGSDIKYLLRLNAETGELDSEWKPQPDNIVNKIIIQGDKLITSGDFGMIGGERLRYFAILDKNSAKAISLLSANSSSNDMTAQNDTLFVLTGGYVWQNAATYGIQAFRNACVKAGNDEPDKRTPFETQFESIISDNKKGWYVGGNFTTLGGIATQRIARINEDLSVDTNFIQKIPISYGGVYNIYTMFLDDEHLYICTLHKLQVEGKNYDYVIRLNSRTGELDTSWRPNPDAIVRTVKTNDTAIFIGGDFRKVYGKTAYKFAALSKINNDLSGWRADALVLTDTIQSFVNKIEIKNDNIYVGGRFTSKINNKNTVALCRLNSKGLIDTTFTFNMVSWYPEVYTMLVKDSLLYFAGHFSLNKDGLQRNHIAAYNIEKNKLAQWNPGDIYYNNLGINSPHWVIANSADTLFVSCFNIDSVQHLPIKNLIALNTATGIVYNNFSPKPNATVISMAASNSKLLFSGAFDYLKYQSPTILMGLDLKNLKWHLPKVINGSFLQSKIKILEGKLYISGQKMSSGVFGEERNCLAVLDPKTFNLLPFNLPALSNDALINDFSLNNDKLYIAGSFSSINNQQRNNLACFDIKDNILTEWNPSSKLTINNLLVEKDKIFTITSTGQGDNLMSAYKRNSLAKINICDNKIEDWQPDIGYSTIKDMLISGDTIFIAGNFQSVNATSIKNLAAIHKNMGGLFTDWRPEPDNQVNKIFKIEEKMFVCGNFNNIANQPAKGFAVINYKDGTLNPWSCDSLNKLTAYYINVEDLVIHNNKLYLAGSFSPKANFNYQIVEIDYTSGILQRAWRWSNSSVNYLTAADSLLFLSGSFYTYNDIGRQNLAAINLNTGNISNWKPNFNEKDFFKQIFIRGKYLYTIGTKNNSPNIAQFKIFKHGINEPLFKWEFYNTNSWTPFNSIVFDDNIIYCGGAFTRIGSNFRTQNLAKLSLPFVAYKPVFTDFSPKSGADFGLVNMNIYGSGFIPGSTVLLTKKGETNIVPDTLFIYNNEIKAVFNTTGKSLGKWTLSIDIPGDTTFILADAFTIEKAEEPILKAFISGPSTTNRNRPTTYFISYSNNSNVAAYAVPLIIATQKDVYSVIDFHDAIIRPANEPKLKYDTIPIYYESDYLFGKAFPCRIYPLIIPVIPPNSTGFLKFTISIGTAFEPAPIKVYIGGSTFEFKPFKSESRFGLAPELLGCYYDIFSTAVELAPGISCIKSFYDNAVSPIIDDYKNNTKMSYMSQFFNGAKLIVDCIPGGAIVTKTTKYLKKTYDYASKAEGTYNSINKCTDFYKKFSEEFTFFIQSFWSVDPNMKYGPAGLGGSNYTNNTGSFDYIITFENDSAATVPAKLVIIEDSLDINKFDMETFAFGPVGLADSIIPVSSALKSFNKSFDMRPKQNYVLDIKADANTETGLIKWTFQALDPTTMLLSEDSKLGFLPPNNKAPNGEGQVMFSVKLKDNIKQGDYISNQASITFDWNEPIITPQWTNIIDTIKPVSKMNDLAVLTTDTSFTVSWNGSDIGSGIYGFNIYVAVNDGSFMPWLISTFEKEAIFTGFVDSVYSFYSLALDSAGNLENKNAVSETSTTIITAVNKINKGTDKIILYQNKPNPFSKQTVISWYLPQKTTVSLEIFDVYGKRIYPALNTTIQQSGYHHYLIDADLPKGIYYYKLNADKYSYIKKFIVL
ncbi:MAG: T9SS type A sorting domain-containing protein [Bacteroidales bacterium]|nr:T9SS type A sorting domain-containing protein [Bacteroidales bacterium]